MAREFHRTATVTRSVRLDLKAQSYIPAGSDDLNLDARPDFVTKRSCDFSHALDLKNPPQMELLPKTMNIRLPRRVRESANRSLPVACNRPRSLGRRLCWGGGDQVGIPQWIKGNAGLWSEGTISDSEFVNSLQYLLGAGILELPITEARAASSPVSDEDTAQSFVVHFSRGPFAEPVSIYSYSLYGQLSKTTQDTSLDYNKYGENGRRSA